MQSPLPDATPGGILRRRPHLSERDAVTPETGMNRHVCSASLAAIEQGGLLPDGIAVHFSIQSVRYPDIPTRFHRRSAHGTAGGRSAERGPGTPLSALSPTPADREDQDRRHDAHWAQTRQRRYIDVPARRSGLEAVMNARCSRSSRSDSAKTGRARPVTTAASSTTS